MSDVNRNIFQRINEVRRAVGYVQKDKSVSTGGGSYKAVTHDQVTAMVRGPMIEAGIVCYPSLVESVSLPHADGAKQFRYEAIYDFTFVNIDAPSESLVVRIQAHAMDNADKAPGKAMSYAKKYALLKLFEIETGEDEESRYQRDEFPLAHHIDLINQCASLDALKAEYVAAIGAAQDAGDKEAVKYLAKAKDIRKAALAEMAMTTASVPA